MTASRLARTPVPLPYPRPEDCSDTGAARGEELCKLRLSKYKLEELVKYRDADNMRTLEGVVCHKDREVARKRFRPNSKNLRNAEYLVSIILVAEGHGDAVPQGWDEPRDNIKTSRKRSHAALCAPAVAVSTVSEFAEGERLPRELELKTALFRHPVMQNHLWKHYATTSAEEQRAHREKYMGRFQAIKTGKYNGTVITILNDYGRWCIIKHNKVVPIQSIQMFEEYMSWLTEHKLGTERLNSWTRARPHMETVALFHGYVPDGFRWQDSEAVRIDLKLKVADSAAAMALDTDGPTVRPHKHTLRPDQLQKFYGFVCEMDAASAAQLLAYVAINFQTLARSGQICQLNRRHLTIDPDAELPRLPSFGLVKLLQLGDRGHHKVADKGVDMVHWVMRTLHPNLACPWFGLALNAALQAKVQGRDRYQDIKTKKKVEVTDVKDLDGFEKKPKTLWKKQPLLAKDGLYESDTFQAQAQPFRRIITEDLIRLITKCLVAMEIANEKKGSKTMLFRHMAIGFLGYLAVNEEDMTTLSKHVDKATAIRGHYKFKHAAVRILMKAGGFSEGIYEGHFNWEGAYIQGRQLATVDLIQAKWPGMWEHFCEAVFPGLLDFKALVDSRGKHNLTYDEEDMRMQAYVDWNLCETLLQDLPFHLWEDQSKDSSLWKALDCLEDPTSPFCVWLHDEFAPWVRQLQHNADRVHVSIRNQRGGRTVLDQARDNLKLWDPKTLNDSRALLQEMVRLLNEGTEHLQALPRCPAALPPAPEIHVPTISLPLNVTSAKDLDPLLHLWEKKLRQYFSPLQPKKTPPAWVDGSKGSGKRFGERKDMLIELDAQVCHAYKINKVKDRAKAVQQVLDAWRIKMARYSFTDTNGTPCCTKLTATDVARCFREALGEKKKDVVQVKAGKSVGGIRQGDLFGNAKDFLRVFKSYAY